MEPQACEYGVNPYYAPEAGDNVWEYWFRQPGNYSIGASHVRGERVRSIQVTMVDATAWSPVRVYGSAEQRARSRRAAHALLGDGGAKLIHEPVRQAALRQFARWRQRSRHVLGVHLRGTDKVVRPKVPPDAYMPLIDAYLAEHADALIFVATDDRRYARRLGARYGFAPVEASHAHAAPTERSSWGPPALSRDTRPDGRLVSLGMGYNEAVWGGHADFSHESKRRRAGGGAASGGRGLQVLLDALLLAQCDYLLMSASAVSEFALWVAPHLWDAHLNLNDKNRFSDQPLPPWTRHVTGARDPTTRRRVVADVFCSTLERACANETERHGKLYGGRYCAKCAPPVV